jgi:type II secretory pathway component PulF
MVRLLIDRHVLKAPMLGAFILQHETARFSRTLGTLLRATLLIKRRHCRWTIILL